MRPVSVQVWEGAGVEHPSAYTPTAIHCWMDGVNGLDYLIPARGRDFTWGDKPHYFEDEKSYLLAVESVKTFCRSVSTSRDYQWEPVKP